MLLLIVEIYFILYVSCSARKIVLLILIDFFNWLGMCIIVNMTVFHFNVEQELSLKQYWSWTEAKLEAKWKLSLKMNGS